MSLGKEINAFNSADPLTPEYHTATSDLIVGVQTVMDGELERLSRCAASSVDSAFGHEFLGYGIFLPDPTSPIPQVRLDTPVFTCPDTRLPPLPLPQQHYEATNAALAHEYLRILEEHNIRVTGISTPE